VALKILLADDSMTAQNMGKRILTEAGYEVVAVSNGAAAIKKITSEHPDIAILDEYMPGYQGSEVCERVKAAAETAKMPVLLTVGKMEPFDQEKANKVHADGVMVKPFEASDLIAAVQSIAQRLLAPTPPPRGVESTVLLRTPSGPTPDAHRTPLPNIPGSVRHEDTIPIPPPRFANVNHEDTLRLTAQEIKAFQDASYQDWANTAEPHLDEEEKAAKAAAAAVPPPIPDEEPETVTAKPFVKLGEPEDEEAEVAEPAAMLIEASEPEAPVFQATPPQNGGSVHEVFSAAAEPVAPIQHAEAAPATPAFYTPPPMEEVTQPLPSVFAVHAAEPEIASVTPAAETEVAPVSPILEPVAETAPAVPVVAAAPVLETSAPLTPGPMPVAPVAELEPTVAPPVDVAAAAASGLEITSPPQERGGFVAQDPALVTETDDMAQFVTKFGVEGAETVHVGVASDLPEEQLSAITHPVEEAVVSPVQEAPVAEVSVEQPVAEVTSPAPLIAAVTPEADVPVVASPLGQVGSIEAVETLESVEPVVAYVPEVQDSQSFPVYREPEPVAVVQEPAAEAVAPVEAASVMEAVAPAAVEAAPEPTAPVAEVAPEVAAVPEPVVPEVVWEAAPATVEAPHEAIVEPVANAAPEVPAMAVAEPAPASEPESAHHAAVVQAVETALAAAAGTAVAAGIAHIVHPETPVVHEAAPVYETAPVHEEPSVDEAAETHPEPVGDAALAEELAAALSKEPETQAAVMAVEANAEAQQSHTVSGISDNQLAEAVTRAFEHLKPQLIMEIIKELMK